VKTWRKFSRKDRVELVRDSLNGIADELQDLAAAFGLDTYQRQLLTSARCLVIDAAVELDGVMT
jgi:hypothetical protein